MKAIKGKYFLGGVHPHGEKEETSSCAIEEMPVPDTVYISCSQSIGRPATPIVEIGQQVSEGETIARAEGAVSANVAASACGTVTDIKDMPGANGVTEKFIVIKTDGREDKAYFPPLDDPTPDEIRQRVRDCGLVGIGGAGFPVAVKISPTVPVDTLIMNGAECEPYLTCDHRLMLERTEQIAEGGRLVAKTLGVTKIMIGIEANKPDCIEAFERFDDIQPVILKKRYPMGGEKQLIYAATGRKVQLGKLPADSGVVVQNVATCYSVYEAVKLGKPLYEKVMTVSGHSIATPKNLLVRVGTPLQEIVDYCGGAKATVRKAVQGGPMTGLALASLNAYTHKTTSGILLMSEKEAVEDEPSPCLNCGKCADVCPMHLMPMNTAFYACAGDYEAAAKYGNTMSCIECGACEYICPAKRPIIQCIRKTKAEMRLKQMKAKG